jgi:hypothetical protein
VSLALMPRLAALAPGRWVQNGLWRRAKAAPSLDLRFAESKSLVDATTGQNLVTFTRASSGTYVGSDGLVKTATTNLLLRSEEFENASWTTGSLNVSVSANETTSPAGTLTADKIIPSTTNGLHTFRQFTSVTSGLSYTQSIFAKASEYSVLQFALSTGFLGNGALYRNVLLSNGSLGNGTLDVSVAPVGDNWYRISATVTATASSGNGRFNLNVLDADTALANPEYAGDGTSGIYIWGAQLEQSATVGEYIPTTSTINSAPRFDHNPTTGESLGLLVEEQRTNLLLQSEDFSTTWGLSTATVSTNVDTAPNGLLTADKLIVNNGASNGYAAQSNSYTSGTTYTFSVYAKAAGATDFRIVLLATSFGSSSTAQFNLSNGTVTSFGGAWSSAAISSVGNGWYRVFGIATATATASSASRFQCTTTGDGSIGVLLWGAQLEAASFPTSYIPTTTATVTRSADVASISGSNFSAWYRQDEGTVFSDCVSTHAATQVLVNIGATAANTGSSSIAIASNLASSQKRVRVRNAASADQASLALGPSSSGSRTRIAAAIKADDFAASLDGDAAVTDTIGTVPTVALMEIGSAPSGVSLGTQLHRRLTYWPQRLSNSTLQTLTQ